MDLLLIYTKQMYILKRQVTTDLVKCFFFTA